jgi:hypothetical protein
MVDIKTFLAAFLLCLMLSMCNRNVVRPNQSQDYIPVLSLKIELTSKNQAVLADSMLQWVARRLQLYADEYHRFRLASRSDSADIVLRIQIKGLKTISSDSLSTLEKKRAVLQKQVTAKINNAEKDLPTKIATANVAANVLVNLVTIPFGFASVIVITGDVDEGGMEEKAFSSTYPTAWVSYTADLGAGSSVIWKYQNVKTFNFRDRESELGQTRLLVRNIIMDLEDRIPVLKPKWKFASVKDKM